MEFKQTHSYTTNGPRKKSKIKWENILRLFATPWTVAHQGPPSIGFSRQEYWSGLPFPSPGDLPDPGTETRSPALQADALSSEPPGKPSKIKWENILRQMKIKTQIKNSRDTAKAVLRGKFGTLTVYIKIEDRSYSVTQVYTLRN